MEAEKFEAFEEDFDEQDATYQVWIVGYREDGSDSDFQVMVNESKSPEAMVEYAKLFADERRYETLSIPEDVTYVEITVDTAVQIDGSESQEGALFRTVIQIK